MKILGIDFTSTPGRGKPITCAVCRFDSGVLANEQLEPLKDFSAFERTLTAPGPWIAGISFPFAQSRRFVESFEWPRDWAAYVSKISDWKRKRFRAELDRYKAPRPEGDKQHKRRCDEILTTAESEYIAPILAKLEEAGFPENPKAVDTLDTTERIRYRTYLVGNTHRIRAHLYQLSLGLADSSMAPLRGQWEAGLRAMGLDTVADDLDALYDLIEHSK